MLKISQAYFSPGSTTKKVVSQISSNFDGEVETYDLLVDCGEFKSKKFSEDELLIIGLPVFAGRIPQIVIDDLNKFKGDNTPVIPVVVYGNRDYDDALLELKDILDENGFKTIGAGAFLAQHSIFPVVASNRPDEKDIDEIDDFAKECIKKLDESIEDLDEILVPGNKPYKEIKILPIMPIAGDGCIECGDCAAICPTEAIPIDHPSGTIDGKCNRCTACIYICPENVRAFPEPMFSGAQKEFAAKCSDRKEPEIFL